MNFKLPKIYPITDPYISGISHFEQVTRLISGGANLIQLRDKHATPAEFFIAATECVAFARIHGVRIVINDRVDIAKAVDADGVHLGQDDMPVVEARKILGENAIIGLSTHSIDQAQKALRDPVDYMAIGPVFATGTKKDPDPVVGLDGVRRVRLEIGDIPLVAIGGIDEQNLAAVLNARADSAAVISALLSDPTNIEKKMRLLTISMKRSFRAEG